MTMEDFDESLSFPTIEEELAASDLPTGSKVPIDRAARIMTCPLCGSVTVLGPESRYVCPNAPHDKEDDTLCYQEFVDAENANDYPSDFLDLDEASDDC